MKHRFSFLLAAFFVLFTGCAGLKGEDAPASAQIFAMDTAAELTAYGPEGQAGVDAARAEINRLEALLSRTRPDSAISALNGAGAGNPVTLDGETFALLALAQDVSEATGGAFDVTVAPVMDAWGWTGGERRVPPPEELAALLPLVGAQDLELNPEASSARLARAGMKADLGGIAKGYAAGRAGEAVQAAGVTCAMLDLGGNITVIGNNPEGIPWRVAVKDPAHPGDYLCVLSLTDCTVSTSGGYERFFEADGVTYHHILDPKTGYPAASGLRSVSVVSENAALADALSTACFVLGAEDALALWRSGGGLDPFELVLCREDGVVTVTEGLEEGLRFLGGDHGYTCETARR